MTPPCCATCAEYNPAGCPGTSPYCADPAATRAARATARVEATALDYARRPGEDTWLAFLDATFEYRDAALAAAEAP